MPRGRNTTRARWHSQTPIPRARNRLAESDRPSPKENMTRTKLRAADLRLRLALRLAVAPRHLFRLLWEPNARPHERDATREALVAFITEGWDSLDIEAAPTRSGVAHTVPTAGYSQTTFTTASPSVSGTGSSITGEAAGPHD